MSEERTEWLAAGPLAELREKGVRVVPGADRPIAVFATPDGVKAVDNRCPHLGFPLHRGTVQDGILTCHWHHARFDLCSGCTFDLFADDVPAYDIEVRGEEVFVAARPRWRDPVKHHTQRLREGMEQNVPLIQAKAILGLLRTGTPAATIVREAALFGARHRDGWASGLTILTAMANLLPYLSEETAYLALYQGCRRVAADCVGMPPRRDRHPLETADLEPDTLEAWLRQWTLVRHRDGAERTLLTAIRSGESPERLTEMLFAAATERFYADTGHALDFCNKAFESVALVGWEHAEALLPTVLSQVVSARGGEESSAWRSPLDLVPLIRELEAELPGLLGRGSSSDATDVPALSNVLLGEDPAATLDALRKAFQAGASARAVAKALCLAAATRIARFGAANEFGDWITALHTFTYCNALHQALCRAESPLMARGLVHGAISVYLDRFLNTPPARLPGESGESLDDLPTGGDALRTAFLTALDQRADIDGAARLVARYYDLGLPVTPLIETLTLACVREDADFHTFQMVEAGVRQYFEWEGRPEGRVILLAIARYLAAHSPTQRAQYQTANIALRLHRGDSLYEEEGVEGHS
jgi:nitrite reductase/ring-hydroxylating ferredoxin subunit